MSDLITDKNIHGRAIRLVFARVLRIPIEDMEDRSMAITPINSGYDSPEYWVISVIGTPPRGTLIIYRHSCNGKGRPAFLIERDKCVRVKGEHLRELESAMEKLGVFK